MQPPRRARPGSIALLAALFTAVPVARAQVQPPVNYAGHGPGTPVNGSSSSPGATARNLSSIRKVDPALAWYSRFVDGLRGTWREVDSEQDTILEIDRTPTLFRLQARRAAGGPAETGYFTVSPPAEDRLSLSWGPSRRLFYGEKTCSVIFDHAGDDDLVGNVVPSAFAFPGVAAGSRWRIGFTGDEIALTDVNSGTVRRFRRTGKPG